METTVVSESPAAAPGCICPGLGPGALYTHTRTHARTHAPGEPRTEQSLPHIPSSRDKMAEGEGRPCPVPGNQGLVTPLRHPQWARHEPHWRPPHMCACVCTHDEALSVALCCLHTVA